MPGTLIRPNMYAICSRSRGILVAFLTRLAGLCISDTSLTVSRTRCTAVDDSAFSFLIGILKVKYLIRDCWLLETSEEFEEVAVFDDACIGRCCKFLLMFRFAVDRVLLGTKSELLFPLLPSPRRYMLIRSAMETYLSPSPSSSRISSIALIFVVDRNVGLRGFDTTL